ncbi:MAG: hypothetical protein GY765_13435, partial [bacterium]|nr:hypothetical protein [bacterium]
MSVRSFDTFSRVIGDIPNLESDLTIGGGAYEPSEKHHNPFQRRKTKTVAYWSGLVKLVRGKAIVPVSIGNYNGSIRFMVVAATDKNYGSTEISAPVFAPFVIQPTVPRYISPGDRLTVPVSIFNKTDSTTDITFTVEKDGPVDLRGKTTRTFRLGSEQEEIVEMQIAAAGGPGTTELKMKAEGGLIISTMDETVSIRPA